MTRIEKTGVSDVVLVEVSDDAARGRVEVVLGRITVHR